MAATTATTAAAARRVVVLAALALAAATLTWAQTRKAGEEAEGQIRQAAFAYTYGMMLGDSDQYTRAARLPLYVVRDGTVIQRDDKQARALLADIAARMKAAEVSQEDRQRIGSNLLALVDQASVQFVGASTASIAIAIRPAAKPGDGDALMELVLHRKTDRWQVIAEVTDSKPVPSEYLKQ